MKLIQLEGPKFKFSDAKNIQTWQVDRILGKPDFDHPNAKQRNANICRLHNSHPRQTQNNKQTNGTMPELQRTLRRQQESSDLTAHQKKCLALTAQDSFGKHVFNRTPYDTTGKVIVASQPLTDPPSPMPPQQPPL